MFRRSVIAYIDILGFSNILKIAYSKDDKKQLQEIQDILRTIYVRLEKDNKDKNDLKLSVSDHVLIVHDISETYRRVNGEPKSVGEFFN